MCGIHGIINKSSTSRYGYEGFMKDGFVAGSLRGMDSSGVFQVDKNNKPFMFKLAVPGSMFVESRFSSAFFRDATSSPLTVGHVRAATVGRATVDNAHPFCVDREDGSRLLGVHNGTLTGWNYKTDASRFDVDSEWALHRIAKEGADAFEVFQGAWALVWWDERTKDKVYVARNTDRTLFFVRTKDKSSILFASEAGMLSWLAERNKIDVEDTIYSFEAGKLYTIDMSGAEVTWSKSNYPVYKTVVYTPSANNNSNNRGHWNPGRARWENGNGRESVNVSGVYGIDDDTYNPEAVDPGCSLDGTNTSSPAKKGIIDELSDDAKEVIDDVKKALAANRDRRFRKSNKETDSKDQKEGTKTVEEYEGTDDFMCKPDWYTAASATVEERKAASEAGVMGELQYFQGVHFEPEISELYGEIEDFIPGNGKVKYDAHLRVCTGSMARRFSPPTGQGAWVAIIGKGSDKKYNGTYYVVSPLNEKGRLALRNKAA